MRVGGRQKYRNTRSTSHWPLCGVCADGQIVDTVSRDEGEMGDGMDENRRSFWKFWPSVR